MSKQSIFIIGIAGASGCGKTHLAHIIKSELQKSNTAKIDIISCDNYYKPYPNGEKAPENFNWDTPESLDLELLTTHINNLKNANTITVPTYDYLTSQRIQDTNSTQIDGTKTQVLILEGLFVLVPEQLRNLIDLKIFTWLDPDICLARRLMRDYKERGISYEQTLKVYQANVKPSYVNFIEPSKKYADLIISTSEYRESNVSLDVIKLYVQTKI